MVGYVDNEDFNIICTLTVGFYYGIETYATMDPEIRLYEGDWEFVEDVQNMRGKYWERYKLFLHYRKLRNIYSENILNYFYVSRDELANKLSEHLTKVKKEKYIPKVFHKVVDNNDISILAVCPENTQNEEDLESEFIITAWLTNCEYDSDKMVNLVHPYCRVFGINGKALYKRCTTFTALGVLAKNAYYGSKDFWDENDVYVDYGTVSIRDRKMDSDVKAFVEEWVTKIANSVKIDKSKYPCFDVECKIHMKESDGSLCKYKLDHFNMDGEIEEEFEPSAIIYYLETEGLYERKDK